MVDTKVADIREITKQILTIMAKYKPIDMVKEYHGKICEHSDTYFQKRGKTLCTGRICEPRNLEKDPYSDEELAVREKFKQARAAVKALIEERKAQGSAFKYTTFKGWLFGKGWQYFDESSMKVVWPERLSNVIGG